MTIIRSFNILMSARHQRWLSLREMLTVQGFPLHVVLTHGVPCSSYSLRSMLASQGEKWTAWPSRRQACQQSGSSMHVAVSGLVLLFALTQVVIEPGILEAQHFQQSRRRLLKPVQGRRAMADFSLSSISSART